MALPPAPAVAPARHVALPGDRGVAASLPSARAIVMLLPQYRSNNAAPSRGGQRRRRSRATREPMSPSKAWRPEFRLAEQHYQNAIAKLEQAARLDQAASGPERNALDPQTAAMLQKNLQVIDQAIAESRSALRSEPLSAAARASLFDALRRKVALLQDTIALMNEMRKGNSAGAAQIVDGLNKS